MATHPSHSDHDPAAGARSPASGRLRRAGVWLVLTFTGVSLGLLSLLPLAPALIWNHTESLPVGLYRVEHTDAARGDIVVVSPAGALRQLFDDYDALPAGRLLLKQLVAASGDTVCREQASITINGADVAVAESRNAAGRPLPAWSGCRRLGLDDVVVLAPHAGSFDSRYFGPIGADQIIGVAHPLLTLPSSPETR